MVSPLALLALSWATWGAGTGTVVVQAPAQVSGLLNGSLLLPCHLQPLEPNAQVTQVTWMRQDSEGGLHKVAVRHPTRGPSLAEPERIRFASADLLDASLRVSELRAEDQANYSCQFATFPMGSGIAWTWLRVLAKPWNTAEAQEVPLRPSTGEPVPVARCSSKGGRPPAKVTWSPFLNGSANSTVEPGPLPGTYTVNSVFTLVPSGQADGRNVTCRVEHESQEEPAVLLVTLAVPYPPEVTISGYDDNWYVGQDEVTLNCEARSNPEPTDYTWNTTTGPLPSFAVAQGTQLLISTNQAINMTFICRVTNALGTSQKEQTILVKDPEGSRLSPGAIIGIVVATIAFVILVVAGILYFKLHRGRDRHHDRPRPSENGDVTYAQVQRDDPLDGPAKSTT
ncbi:poliovirus receptor [Marmota marmota marmota]|uniref:poliovirus receptor n=1 Tax=Marmota marmota marmota TaxID=9994 RepID=UPI002092C4F0|nr:poliovirus receptor [Marmota marmota marmota]